jgi:hypothetical protein
MWFDELLDPTEPALGTVDMPTKFGLAWARE